MNGTIVFILGFILFILIVLAIIYHKSLKNIKNIIQQAADARTARKIAEEEAYFKRTSTKHYHEEQKPNFKKDYFKGAGTEEKPKAQTQAQGQPQPQPQQQQKPKQETTTRKTVETDSGVTIIDDRNTQKKTDRKIFDDGEGEYVDFVEVKD